MAVLPIPANYYDDLVAKFGLDDELVARLADGNILYDRDAGGGEFFQLYTVPFEDRFALELVERAAMTAMAPPTPRSAWPPRPRRARAWARWPA